MDNTNKILKELGAGIVNDAKRYLKARKKDKRSSGKLRRSLKSKVSDNELTIFAEDYAIYVDQGTRDSKGNLFLTDAITDNINKYEDQLMAAIFEDISNNKI